MILRRKPGKPICFAGLLRKMEGRSFSNCNIEIHLPNQYRLVRVVKVSDTGVFIRIRDIETDSEFSHHFEYGKWITESMEKIGERDLKIVGSFTTKRFNT